MSAIAKDRMSFGSAAANGRGRREFWPADKNRPDPILLSVILGLTLFGAVMVFSASGMYAEKIEGTRYYFLLRQLVFIVLGLVGMYFAMRFDYTKLRNPKLIKLLLLACAAMLIAVMFFHKINGAHRWIRFRSLSFQPSELTKLVVIIYLAFLLERRAASGEIRSFKRTFLPSCLLVGLFVTLVLAEPDLGTALLIAATIPVLHFAAGVPVRYHLLTAIATSPVVIYMLFFVNFRAGRLKAYLDPFAYQLKEGYQTVQSLIAVGSGGVWGLGFANGRQKLLFLPEAHTDFIFSIIAEELGLIGALTLILVFAVLMWRGLRAAVKVQDGFGRLLAIGLTMSIVLQAFFNISVAINLLPAKGLPLPFVSYGGSSLLFTLIGAGLLLNVSCATTPRMRATDVRR